MLSRPDGKNANPFRHVKVTPGYVDCPGESFMMTNISQLLTSINFTVRTILRTALVVIALALLFQIASPAQSAKPAEPTGAAALFGVDDQGILSGNPDALNLAVATGVNWTRIAVSWSAIEGTQGTYNFSSADSALNHLTDAGLSPIVYLTDNPAWAATTRCGPVDTTNPARVTALGNVMGALAARYTKIKIWALYSEIDSTGTTGDGCFGTFGGGGINHNGVPDYKEYGIELAAAWKAVHTANPDASLAVGALAYDNFDPKACPPNYPANCYGGGFNYTFPRNLFRYMSKHPLANDDKYMDQLLFNYYDLYGRYWELVGAGYGVQAKADALRTLMRAKGVSVVDLLVTETGEDSSPNWVGLQGQAHCLEITLVRGAAAGLKGIVWWTFEDFPDSAPPPRNTWKYGIADENLQPKPSYQTLQTLASELNGLDFKNAVSDKPGMAQVEGYRFAGGGVTKYVVWSNSIRSTSYKSGCAWARNSRPVTLKASSLRVVNYQGQVNMVLDNSKRDQDPQTGSITIRVGNAPKIVQIIP